MEFLASLAIKALIGTSICGTVTVGAVYGYDKTLLGFSKDDPQNLTDSGGNKDATIPEGDEIQKDTRNTSNDTSSASVGNPGTDNNANPGSVDGEKEDTETDSPAGGERTGLSNTEGMGHTKTTESEGKKEENLPDGASVEISTAIQTETDSTSNTDGNTRSDGPSDTPVSDTILETEEGGNIQTELSVRK